MVNCEWSDWKKSLNRSSDITAVSSTELEKMTTSRIYSCTVYSLGNRLHFGLSNQAWRESFMVCFTAEGLPKFSNCWNSRVITRRCFLKWRWRDCWAFWSESLMLFIVSKRNKSVHCHFCKRGVNVLIFGEVVIYSNIIEADTIAELEIQYVYCHM